MAAIIATHRILTKKKSSSLQTSSLQTSSTKPLDMTEENKIKFLEKYKNFVDLHQIMIITHDESTDVVIKDYKIRDYISKIKKYKPKLIIFATQKSPLGGDNYQTRFKKFLFESENNKYKLLAKVDSLRKRNSGFTGGITSYVTFSSVNSLRTRIYYNSDEVFLKFKNNRLSEQSSFTLSNSYENKYNSKNNSTPQNSLNNTKMSIERYHMKRDTYKDYPKSGNGKISVGIQLKLPNNEKLYTLIISNYDYDRVKNTTALKSLNFNNFFNRTMNDKTYAITLSPGSYAICPSPNPENKYGLNKQVEKSIKNELKFKVYTFYGDNDSNYELKYKRIIEELKERELMKLKPVVNNTRVNNKPVNKTRINNTRINNTQFNKSRALIPQ